MLARDLLDLQATTVLTQSKVRRIFYSYVLNPLSRLQFFRSYLRNMTRFISLNSSRFKTAVY